MPPSPIVHPAPSPASTQAEAHPDTMAPPPSPPAKRQGLSRTALLGAGYAFLALGAVGAFLPLLPTTVFWLLAVACFLRSSPRVARRVLRHRHAGPAVRNWLRYGTISRSGKTAACAGMTVGFAATGAAFDWSLLPLAIAAALLVPAAAFVLSRPTMPAVRPPRRGAQDG